MSDVLTYCEGCLENLDDDKFDYRFDFPICHDCVEGSACGACGEWNTGEHNCSEEVEA